MLLPDLSDEEFVEVAYHRILNREPDDEGFRNHLECLKSGKRTRLGTLAVLIESDEFVESLDICNYEFYKGREVWAEWRSDKDYYIKKLLRSVEDVGGVAVELGVYRGHSAEIIANNTDKRLFLFDTFEGLPEGQEPSGHDTSDTSVQKVKEKISGEVKIMQGDVKKTVRKFDDKPGFAHFDLDHFKPTLKALKNLYSKAMPNAIFLFDEYGDREWEEHEREAVDQFLKDKPEEVISLKTGQGFFIKK